MTSPASSASSPAAASHETVEWERKPKDIDANLRDYDAVATTFDWKQVEREFTWSKTGKVNIVHEAIDRHAEGTRANKVALFYTDFAGRDERYTFQDLKVQTSRFANVLKALGVKRGDRVGVFLPRTPELYIAILGIHRMGAIPPRSNRTSRPNGTKNGRTLLPLQRKHLTPNLPPNLPPSLIPSKRKPRNLRPGSSLRPLPRKR